MQDPRDGKEASAAAVEASAFASFAASPPKLLKPEGFANASQVVGPSQMRRVSSVGIPETEELTPPCGGRPRSLSAGASDFLEVKEAADEAATPERPGGEDAEFATPPTTPVRFQLEVTSEADQQEERGGDAVEDQPQNLLPDFKPLDLLLASPVRQPAEAADAESSFSPAGSLPGSMSPGTAATLARQEFPDLPPSPLPQPLASTPLRYRLPAGEAADSGATSEVGAGWGARVRAASARHCISQPLCSWSHWCWQWPPTNRQAVASRRSW